MPDTADSVLRFDGRVAVVTGAGSGLGRAYARLLADRGATVVVNDLGSSPDGHGSSPEPATTVAEAIGAAGGDAVADFHTVAEEDGARAIVAGTVERFGRIDVLVNNAGIAMMATFDEITSGDIAKLVSTHLLGAIWTCHEAWPHMRRAGYGRIVNITSRPSRHLTIYGAAKYGVQGLTEGLAAQVDDLDLRVNAVHPVAGTRMVEHITLDNEWRRRMFAERTPEKVAPIVALLAHELCPANGRTFTCGGGEITLRTMAASGAFRSETPTIEDILAGWSEVTAGDPGDRPSEDLLHRPGETFAPAPYVPGGRGFAGGSHD